MYRIDNAPSSAEGTDEVHAKLRRVIADALAIWQTHIPIDFVHEREAGVDADVAFEFSFYRGKIRENSRSTKKIQAITTTEVVLTATAAFLVTPSTRTHLARGRCTLMEMRCVFYN